MVSKASQGPAIPKDDGDGDVQNSMVSHTVANQAVPVGLELAAIASEKRNSSPERANFVATDCTETPRNDPLAASVRHH